MLLSIRWRKIFEQFDLVPGRLENSDGNFCAGNASNFTGELAGVMRAMRKLETENITPESEGPLEIRNRETRVISGNDSKLHISENVQHGIQEVDRPLRRAMLILLGFADIILTSSKGLLDPPSSVSSA